MAFQRRDGKKLRKTVRPRLLPSPRNSFSANPGSPGSAGNRLETRSTSNYREEHRDFLPDAIIGKKSRTVPLSRGRRANRQNRENRRRYSARAGACYNYYIEKREQSELTAHRKLTCVPFVHSEYVCFSILFAFSSVAVPLRTEGPPTSDHFPTRLAFSVSVRSFPIVTTPILREPFPLYPTPRSKIPPLLQ